MDVLVTGFDKFGHLNHNPSQFIVEELGEKRNSFSKINLFTEILPTEFERTEEILSALLDEIKPRVVLSLGVSEALKFPEFERVALNINDAKIPDNIGYKPEGAINKPNGKEAYISQFPIESLIKEMKEQDLKIGVSNHAGTFVCNHVYYITNYLIEKKNLDTSCCFIHIPYSKLDQEKDDQTDEFSLADTLMVIEQIINALPKYFSLIS